MILPLIAQLQCLSAQPWRQALVYLADPLRYHPLHESRFRSQSMRSIPSLDGPLKASRRLLRLVWKSAGCRAKGLRSLNLHRAGSTRPRLRCAYLKSSRGGVGC
jgi:hypothetical protein